MKDRYVTSALDRPRRLTSGHGTSPSVGHRGWVGFRLDVGAVEWDEASELLVASYCLSAPKKLAAAVTP